MNLEKVHMSVSKSKKKNSILQRKKFYRKLYFITGLYVHFLKRFKKYAKKFISKTPWPSTAI